VTAARCVITKNKQVPPETVTAFAGRHLKNKYAEGEQIRQATKVLIHPNHQVNDIALIKLKQPIKFTKTIRPICLPTQGQELPPRTNGYGMVAGWGRTNTVLKELQVPIHDAGTCTEGWSDRPDKVVNHKGWGQVFKADEMICAEIMDGDQAACQNDHGSILAWQPNDKPMAPWQLLGVKSFGVAGCMGKERFTVFARVSNYVDWINKEMKKMTSVK